ncbi:MAG: glycosyltransferase family 2 protein [Nitrospirae bacterium]|nr:glycosyltransferase family 2 protein [Nitrospirota bacterium]
MSIVIPVLNEEDNIPRLEQELLAAIAHLPYQFEFLVVDNHSADGTRERVKAICQRDDRWKYLRFSRNFTVEMSITAGYHFASGDAIIVLYSDLQDPPDVVPRLIEKWREGYDVVFGVREVRPGDPAWRNFAVKVAYRLINRLSDVPIPENTGDFRLITRRVRDALEQCGEYNRYLRGLIAWLGFRQIGIPYERRPRTAGASKAPLWDLIFFVFNAITSFSLKPLRLFTLMGFVLIGMSLIAACVYSFLYLIGSPPPGITTLIVLSFLGIGLNSLGIGVLGEYLGRAYAETKHRPLYVVEESVNVPWPNRGAVETRG